MTDTPERLLIWDAAPDHLLDREVEQALAGGLAVTLNLWRTADPAALRTRWTDRVDIIDQHGFDQAALIGEIVRDGQSYEAIKTRANVPLRAELFEAATRSDLRRRLRVVAQVGAGTNNIDVDAATRCGVTVTHTPGANADAVAEFVLGQILAMVRDLVGHNDRAHRGVWPSAPFAPARQLGELTLGIVGFGRTGRALAARATALGMTVQTASTSLTQRPAGPLPVRNLGSLEELLRHSDVVSLHVPLSPRTRGLIGRRELAWMRPGAMLVNTARGGIVDESALAEALRDPRHPLAAAAVDTFAAEHDAFASPLFGVERALLTPHIAGMTGPAMATASAQCIDQIVNLLAGRTDGIPIVRPLAEEGTAHHV